MSQDKPMLGLASTREMLNELDARAEVSVEHHADAVLMAECVGEMLDRLTQPTLDYVPVDADGL